MKNATAGELIHPYPLKFIKYEEKEGMVAKATGKKFTAKSFIFECMESGDRIGIQATGLFNYQMNEYQKGDVLEIEYGGKDVEDRHQTTIIECALVDEAVDPIESDKIDAKNVKKIQDDLREEDTEAVSEDDADDLVYDDYHFQHPLGEHSFSSSQVKTAAKNAFKFHKETVKGEKAPYSPTTLDAFTVGHFFHTHFLEPHLLHNYVKYEGRKAGKVWAAFQEANEGKRILTSTMATAGDTLISGVEASKPAMNMLKIPFETEVSFFTKMNGVKVKCRYDQLHENVDADEHVEALKGMHLLNKGADLSNLSIGGDLKSTAESDLEDEDVLRKIIKNYSYDVSFAFYKDIYEIVTGKPLDAWYWIIASKKLDLAKLVWADESYYRLGRSKYTKGMQVILDFMADEWAYRDKPITLAPAGYEMTSIQKEVNEEDEI